MAKLTLIRGLPGSGKSTLARSMDAAHFEADQFMTGKDGRYLFDPKRLQECHRKCLNRAGMMLRKGVDVVVANTFSRMWEIQPYLDMAKSARADVQVIECKGRWPNVHNVPQSAIDRMADRWETYK